MFENLIEILKKNPRKIVYTEGTDARILESADRLKKGGFLTPVLVGNVDDVKAAAAKGGFDIEGLEILDPATYDRMDEMVSTMVELRKGKMTADECRASLMRATTSAPCSSRWALQTLCSAARPTPLRTPCVPRSSSSRPRRVQTS